MWIADYADEMWNEIIYKADQSRVEDHGDSLCVAGGARADLGEEGLELS